MTDWKSIAADAIAERDELRAEVERYAELQGWIVRHLTEETLRATEAGADYLSADCPACDRRRLQTPEGECEKCGWTLDRASVARGGRDE